MWGRGRDGSGTHARCTRGLALGAALALTGCDHDFSVFDPLPGEGEGGADDASSASSSPDASTPHDSGGAHADSGTNVPPSDDGGCGSDCLIEAISCAGTCAQIEQSCAAACASGDTACASTCVTSEKACASQCVSQCETCTSDEQCYDPTGCTSAAP